MFSLHTIIPFRKDDPAEYWKVHLPRSDPGPRILCCLCHVLFGFPTDGWTAPPDGNAIVTASVPEMSHA